MRQPASPAAVQAPAACGGSCASGRRPRAAGSGADAAARPPPPDPRLGGQHLVAHRMVETGPRQIGGIERLVDHRAVGPVLERPHHRRRDVPRPRPHGDPRDLAHCASRRWRATRVEARVPWTPALASRTQSCASGTPATVIRGRRSERDDAAQHLAAVHLRRRRPRRRRGAIVSRDELVQRQPALQVEVDQHREVAGRQAVAVPGRLQRAAAAEDVDAAAARAVMSGVGTPTSTTVPARSRA